MLLLPSLSVLGVVALGPQVVLGSFKFKLSPVVQCEPVSLTFSGSDFNNHSVPTTLTILPLIDNAPPIRIPIPNGASNSTGIQLTFIPLAAETRFIASLDELQGPSGSAKVSDVTKVNAANDTADAVTTCLGSGIPQVNFYQFSGDLFQCEPFTVNYDPAITPNAPNITAFNPRGDSYRVLPNDDSNATPGTASYIMNGEREDTVVLLFDDWNGHTQTTKLMTILGDSSSSKSCLKSDKESSNNNNKKTSSSRISQAAIIGIAVAASIIGLLAILLLIYMLRERRRRRHASDMVEFDPALLNRRWPDGKRSDLYQPSPPPFTPPPPPFSGDFSGDFVRDPIYTDEKAASVMSDARTSIASWNQFIPEDQRNQQTDGALGRRPSVSSSRLSMNTVDIQNILQMATVHRDRSSGGVPPVAPQPSTAGTAMTTFDLAKPAVARLVSTRRSRRTSDPPDMPVAVSRNNSAAAAAVAGVPVGYGPSPYVTFGDSDDDDEGAPNTRQSDGGIGGFPVPVLNQSRNRDTSESWGNVVVR
ncbi:hypothetical protein C8R43DRAFT_1129933 [Mycena crocata]|nr:hypothetical protein C8R43DRAFT_1129933 [Mycena crocata]